MPTFYQFEVFSAVAKHLNITRAARELHVSQSAVSQQIGRLEEYLRVALIKKTRRGVELTAEGTRIQSEVKKFLPRINALKTKSGPRN